MIPSFSKTFKPREFVLLQPENRIFQFPSKIFEIVFQYLDIFHVTKNLPVCRSFLSFSLSRLREYFFLDQILDKENKDHESRLCFCFQEETEKNLFFPGYFIWREMFSGHHNYEKIDVAKLSLKCFYNLIMSRELESVTDDLGVFDIKSLNLWEFGRLIKRLRKRSQLYKTFIKNDSFPSPWNIHEEYLAKLLESIEKEDNLFLSLRLIMWCSFFGHQSYVKAIFERLKTMGIRAVLYLTILKCLMIAATAGGSLEMIQFLLKLEESSFLPILRRTEENFVIQIACFLGYTNIVKFFLEELNVSLTLDQNCCLRASCRQGHTDIVKILMRTKGVDPGDGELNRPLRNALKKDRNEVVKLLQDDPRVTQRDILDVSFQVSCLRGDVETVKKQLKDPKVRVNANRNFCLTVASELGKSEIVKLLLQDKRIDPSDHDNLAFRLACQNGHHESAKLLLEDNRVDPTAGNNFALNHSSQNGHVEVVKLLLRDGRSDPSNNLNFPLNISCEKHHFEISELLLGDRRVDPALSYNCFFRLCCQNGASKLIKKLMKDKRIDPSACDDYSLMWTSKYGMNEIVRILLEDPRVKVSARQYSAIELASEYGRFETLKILIPKVEAGKMSEIPKSELVRLAMVHVRVGERFDEQRRLSKEDVKERREFLCCELKERFPREDSRGVGIRTLFSTLFVPHQLFLYL